jgi:hypothetical protein
VANVNRRLDRLETGLAPAAEAIVFVGGDFDLAHQDALAKLGIEAGQRLKIIRLNGAERFLGVAHCDLPELFRHVDGKTRDILGGKRA